MSTPDVGVSKARHEPAGHTRDSRAGESDQAAFTVEIVKAALDTILHEVRLGGTELETGGILLGHDRSTGCRILVAGGPGPNAVRQPLAFNRDLAYTQALANLAWDEHQAMWLGEWHTHPTAAPVPSDIDIASYRTHLADPELGFTRFISVIVGLAHSPAAAPGRFEAPDEHHQPEEPGDDGSASDDASGSDDSPVAVAWVVDREGAGIAPLLPIEECP